MELHAQRCHTNSCSAGIATTDRYLQRGLNVDQKAERAYQFHRNTVRSVSEILGACGLNNLGEMNIKYLSISNKISGTLHRYDLVNRSLLERKALDHIQEIWEATSSEEFSII